MVIALLLSPARTVFPIVPWESCAQKMRHFLYTFGAKTVPEHPEKQHTGMIYHDELSLLTLGFLWRNMLIGQRSMFFRNIRNQ